jgi:hypothetical protein
MNRRKHDEPSVPIDTSSRSLGLEDYLPERKDPVLREEKHYAGEKCLHWLRRPDGSVGHMTPIAAVAAPCRWCQGTGKLLGTVTIKKRELTKSWVAAADGAAFEEARKAVRPRRVA